MDDTSPKRKDLEDRDTAGERVEPADVPREPPERHRANPRYTTTDGWLTVPEFGAAGSGGAEYEPGPDSDSGPESD